MIDAHDREAIEGNIGNEIKEAGTDIVETAVMIEMFGVDIRNYRYGRRQVTERSITFIRLDNHPVPLPQARIRAIGIDDAAIDDSWVKAAFFQYTANQ